MGAAGGAALAGLSLFSAYNQAEGAKAMGQYQNKMAKINERQGELMAEDAISRGKDAATNYQKKVNQITGTQRASFAASGVDVGYGSAQAIQDQTREIGAADVATIKNNAFLEAMGYRAEAQNASRRGRLALMAGNNEATNTLLTGGIKAADQVYSNYGKKGG